MLPLFLLTSALLIATPGPNWIYILTRGRHRGGAQRSFRLLAWAVVSSSIHWQLRWGCRPCYAHRLGYFLLIKYAGGAYLLYLGLKALLARDGLGLRRALSPRLDARDLVRQSITQSLLNPKTALFFLTFLPQFVPLGSTQPMLDMLGLGLLYMFLTVLIYGALGVFSGTLGTWLRARPAAEGRFRFLTAGAFIGLGVWALWPDRR